MKPHIKCLILATWLALGATLSAQTTTNTPPLPPVATNGVLTTSFLSGTLQWLKDGTNFIVVPYGILTVDDHNKYGGGGGIALGYEVSQYFVSGMRLEYINKAFYQGSFTGQLQIPVTLFGKVTVVPFLLGGVSVPFGGGAQDPSSVQGVAGTGLAVRLSSKVDVLMDIEKRSATPGQQICFGIGYRF